MFFAWRERLNNKYSVCIDPQPQTGVLQKTLHDFTRESHNFTPPSPSAYSGALVGVGLCRMHKTAQSASMVLREVGQIDNVVSLA